MTVRGIRLKLAGEGVHGKNTKVWIGGEEYTDRVQRVDVSWDCQNVTVAAITFLVENLDIEGDVFIAPKKRRWWQR